MPPSFNALLRELQGTLTIAIAADGVGVQESQKDPAMMKLRHILIDLLDHCAVQQGGHCCSINMRLCRQVSCLELTSGWPTCSPRQGEYPHRPACHTLRAEPLAVGVCWRQ